MPAFIAVQTMSVDTLSACAQQPCHGPASSQQSDPWHRAHACALHSQAALGPAIACVLGCGEMKVMWVGADRSAVRQAGKNLSLKRSLNQSLMNASVWCCGGLGNVTRPQRIWPAQILRGLGSTWVVIARSASWTR